MRVNELFFELSHENRLAILRLLQKRKMKNKQISESLDTSHTETVRHLMRLGDIGLIEKDMEGYYLLSPLGTTLLTLVSVFDFLSEKDGYMRNHIPNLPPAFEARIGALTGSSVISEVMNTLGKSTQIIENAKKYVWFMADQINTHNLPFLKKKMQEGMEFRFIQRKGYTPPPGFEWSEEPFPDVRFLNEWSLNVYLNECEGMLRFYGRDGKIDYATCLYSTKQEFHSFCYDLFLSFWKKIDEKL